MLVFREPNQANFFELCNPEVVVVSEPVCDKEGFLFHPFDADTNSILFFEGKKTKHIPNQRIKQSTNSLLNEEKKELLGYTNTVKRAIDEIVNQDFDKLVVARTIEFNGDLNCYELFYELSNCYPSAFVYLLQYEETVYIGATPEQFIKREEDKIHSASLAGTVAISEGINIKSFTSKEIEEQAYVTNYIKQVYHKYCRAVDVGDTEVLKAGSVAHIYNGINGELIDSKHFKALLKELHPTPAVCGLPKEKSFEWILENEGIERAYYTGFLGYQTALTANYFVNLRCLKYSKSEITIYVGGGITGSSQVEHELEETNQKAKTLLQAMTKMHNFA